MTFPGNLKRFRKSFPLLVTALLLSGCVKHYRYLPSEPALPPAPSRSVVLPEPAEPPAPARQEVAAYIGARRETVPSPPAAAQPPAVKTTAPPAPSAPVPAPVQPAPAPVPARVQPAPAPTPAQATPAVRRQNSPPLEKMGYAIQVGAFANLDNAVRLERVLAKRGVDAYYFRHESGLYKVRFGNHGSYKAARQEAEKLQKSGTIDLFFIVEPQHYPAARSIEGDRGDLRAELVRTARRFLGVPYRWGGTDHEEGFDCSGLTLVCYRLNGLNLPRESRYQFRAGRLIPKEELRPGDLVFFATRGGKRVSHVGIFIGDGRFIHAPRTGQDVRIDALADPFYTRTYIGGRSYF